MAKEWKQEKKERSKNEVQQKGRDCNCEKKERKKEIKKLGKCEK